jgi:DMSO reductase family type II enzyme heme b subunit
MRRLGILAVAIVALVILATPATEQESVPAGKATYDKWCAGCHGIDGKGQGPTAGTMLPRPRDFTTALYQIRSTPSGALPTDEDLLAIIDHGMPGTAMPGWSENLSADERGELIDYLKTFSPAFEREPAEPVELGDEPGVSEEGIAEGREFFEKIECWKCHGLAGRGDGQSAPTLEDDQEHPIRAADLTENWNFNGGGTSEDIMRRLMTGLNGTPMPANADLIDAEFMTRDQLWRVAQYVRSLSPEEPPVVREVVRAARVEGDLPATVDDPAWQEVERYYIPLVGQIVVKPRWFAPTVDGVWVQALHDEREVALRLLWHDPSRSPDSEWDEWTAKVRATMEPELEEPARAPGDAAAPVVATNATATVTDTTATSDTTTATAVDARPGEPLSDVLAVQFPTAIPEGMERPYFLMGSERDPVYLWYWWSDRDEAEEAVARGFAATEPLTVSAEPLTAVDTFDQGEWRVVLRRAFDSGEIEHRLRFETGRPIPLAFFAWDGSNGESGTQGAISTWYFLYLDRPTSPTVYVAPLVATLLAAALGVVVVARAQRRTRDGSRRS